MFLVAGACERIVVTERASRDAQIAYTGIVREDDGERNDGLSSAPALVENVGDRLGREGTAAMRLDEGDIELCGAVRVE